MKKSLRPQQAAPVQRETTATITSTGVGVVAANADGTRDFAGYAFAGEDAQ